MENATKKGEQKQEKAGPKVRLRWEQLSFGKPFVRAIYRLGTTLIVQFDESKSTWSGSVSPKYQRHDFATKEEAQLYCESVLTGMLLRDLGELLGENWSDRPGKTRSRIVTDMEMDDGSKEPDIRSFHTFVICPKTQQLSPMHDDACTTHEGKPCDCPLNRSFIEEAVGHA